MASPVNTKIPTTTESMISMDKRQRLKNGKTFALPKTMQRNSKEFFIAFFLHIHNVRDNEKRII